MGNKNVTLLPDSYKHAVAEGLRGNLQEVSYNVSNYINISRKLVTNQNLSAEEAGRETVGGDPIVKKCNVYLPAGYDQCDSETKYNVLYLLHGVGGNRFEWLTSNGETDGRFNICNIFDNLISKGEIAPLIVVFPDGRSAEDWTDTSFNAEGTNMLGFYYFDYEMRYDLIPFIEANYNTYSNIKDTSDEGMAYNRLHRALGGLSMGGMQTLNLGLGGHRCDSAALTGDTSAWKNGLTPTVLAPGMMDLFAYAGAFSNAPTSSDGKILGASVAAWGYKLHLLYITCGDKDGIAFPAGYEKSTNGLEEAAGDNLGDYYRVVMKDCVHDFEVWNNGAYNFARLAFGKSDTLRIFDVCLDK